MAITQSYSATIFLLFCLNLFQTSTALKCYTCQYMDSRGDRECLNSPPPSRYLTDCNQPQCWKKYSNYNGVTNVQRFCGAIATDRTYCQESSFENILRGEIYPATECFCNTEGCNGSTKLTGLHGFSNNGIVMSLVIAASLMLFTNKLVGE